LKILFINQTFYPDVVATAQQLTCMAVDLAAQGHEVTVLAARRGYAFPHPLYKKEEIYRGVRVARVCGIALGRKFKMSRLLDALVVNAAFWWKLFWMGRFDRVVALTSPPLVAWSALGFAKRKKSEFVYWIMDLNPDQAIAAGWLKKNSLAAGLLTKCLKSILRHSDKIVALDRFMKERILSYGADVKKIEIVPPSVDCEDIEPVDHVQNPFRKAHGLEGKFVVMYSGNHGLAHPLDTVLEAARALKEEASIVFVFVGGGERVKEVSDFKKKYQLQNIFQLPYQERSNLKYSLSAADLHVVTMDEAFVGALHPCKIYAILKIGRPFVFIGPAQSPIGDLTAQNPKGHRVDHGDFKRLVEIIQQVKNKI
jgi:glycosyltransferase involved in cell wall biosynthesis